MQIRRSALAARAAGAVVFTLFFAALVSRGASEAPLAAGFAFVLCVLLAIEVAIWPSARLAAALRQNWITLLAAIAFVGWSLSAASIGPPTTPAPWRALWHPLWAEFGFAHGAVSISPYRTIEGVAAFLAPAAAFALGALNVQSRDDRDWTGRFVAALAICFAFFSLALLVQGAGLRGGRLMSRLGSPNAAATIFGVFALFMSALVVRGARGRLGDAPAPRTPNHPLLAWLAIVQGAPITFAALVLVGASALLTGSRAGLLVSAGALLVFIALLRAPATAGDGRDSRSVSVTVMLGAVALLLFLLGGGDVIGRIGAIDGDSAARRIIIETHWQAFLDRPLLGHGLNTFHELNVHYARPENWPSLRPIGSAHNIFVQLLEETGLVGAVLFTLMLAPPLWRALKIAWLDRSGAEWAAASIGGAVLCFGHGAVDFGLQVPALAAIFAYTLGAFSRIESAQARTPIARRLAGQPEPKDAAFRFRNLKQ